MESIDLSFLDADEQEALSAVLDRNQKVRNTDERRIQSLLDSGRILEKAELRILTGEWFHDVKKKIGKTYGDATSVIRRSLRIKKRRNSKQTTEESNKPLATAETHVAESAVLVEEQQAAPPETEDNESFLEKSTETAVAEESQPLDSATTTETRQEINEEQQIIDRGLCDEHTSIITTKMGFNPKNKTETMASGTRGLITPEAARSTPTIRPKQPAPLVRARSESHVTTTTGKKPATLQEILAVLSNTSPAMRRRNLSTSRVEEKPLKITEREMAIFDAISSKDEISESQQKPDKFVDSDDFFTIKDKISIDMNAVRELVQKESMSTSGTTQPLKRRKLEDPRSYYISFQ